MTKALFIEFHNVSPHIETSLELAKRHLDDGDRVEFVFLGHAMPYREFLNYAKLEALVFRRWMPERQGARLIRHPNLKFVGGVRLPRPEAEVAQPKTLNELKSVTYKGADIGMGVASSLISRTRNSHFDPSINQGLVRRALLGCMQAYDYTYDLIQEVQPDLVYIFNGRLCHPRAALRAAQYLDMHVRVHDRGADTRKYVVRDFTPHDREKIQQEIAAVWDSVGSTQIAVDAADTWFRERRAGSPRDWYSFTGAQRKNELPELVPGKRLVTYFSSSDDEFAAIGDSYRWKGWKNQLDAVKHLIEAMDGRTDSQLVVRIHPHLMQKHPADLKQWLAIGNAIANVTVIGPGSPVDSYALLDASDVVVTGGSTIGLEAVYWGKPSILLGPSEYDSFGAVHLAHTNDELNALLDGPALSVDRASAMPYGYYRSTYGETFKFFEPTDFIGGAFLGVDIHRLPWFLDIIHRLRVRIWSKSTRDSARRRIGRLLAFGARN